MIIRCANFFMQLETQQLEPQWKRLKKLNLVGAKFAYLSKVTLIDRAIAKIFLPLLPPAVTPNAITVFRFLSIPVIAYLLVTDFIVAGAALFALSAFSDALDGALARTTRQISKWGIIADPLADKLLVGTVAVIMISKYLGFALAAAIIGIELLLVASAYFRYRGRITPAKTVGKIKMILQCVGIIFLFFFVLLDGSMWLAAAQVTLYLAVVFAVLSLLLYKSI